MGLIVAIIVALSLNTDKIIIDNTGGKVVNTTNTIIIDNTGG